jgi:hypothetical protein
MAHPVPGLTFPPYAELDNRLPNRRMQCAKLCKTSKNDVAPLLSHKDEFASRGLTRSRNVPVFLQIRGIARWAGSYNAYQ